MKSKKFIVIALFLLIAALVLSACASIAKAKEAPGVQADLALAGAGNCLDPQAGKDESGPFVGTADPGYVISAVAIKTGLGGCLNSPYTTDGTYEPDTGGPNACYQIVGIGTSSVTVTKVGQGAGAVCQDISHIEWQVEETDETCSETTFIEGTWSEWQDTTNPNRQKRTKTNVWVDARDGKTECDSEELMEYRVYICYDGKNEWVLESVLDDPKYEGWVEGECSEPGVNLLEVTTKVDCDGWSIDVNVSGGYSKLKVTPGYSGDWSVGDSVVWKVEVEWPSGEPLTKVLTDTLNKPDDCDKDPRKNSATITGKDLCDGEWEAKVKASGNPTIVPGKIISGVWKSGQKEVTAKVDVSWSKGKPKTIHLETTIVRGEGCDDGGGGGGGELDGAEAYSLCTGQTCKEFFKEFGCAFDQSMTGIELDVTGKLRVVRAWITLRGTGGGVSTPIILTSGRKTLSTINPGHKAVNGIFDGAAFGIDGYANLQICVEFSNGTVSCVEYNNVKICDTIACLP